jgi:hypothetical protein
VQAPLISCASRPIADAHPAHGGLGGKVDRMRRIWFVRRDNSLAIHVEACHVEPRTQRPRRMASRISSQPRQDVRLPAARVRHPPRGGHAHRASLI